VKVGIGVHGERRFEPISVDVHIFGRREGAKKLREELPGQPGSLDPDRPAVSFLQPGEQLDIMVVRRANGPGRHHREHLMHQTDRVRRDGSQSNADDDRKRILVAERIAFDVEDGLFQADRLMTHEVGNQVRSAKPSHQVGAAHGLGRQRPRTVHAAEEFRKHERVWMFRKHRGQQGGPASTGAHDKTLH
jgi:hypothetical protein